MLHVAALLVGCGPSAPQPELSEVVPARGWREEVTDVVIGGDHLLPMITLGDEDPVGGDFEAWLETPDGDVRLEGAELVDYDHLAAQVPAGLTPGTWPLRVRTPSGGEARLEPGFLVSTTRADHLRLQADRAGYALGEYAEVVLELQDPRDEVVPLDVGVQIEATSGDGAVGVEFAPDQLAGQEPLEAGVGIRGRLDADGASRVLVRSTSADDVRFTARALDEAGVDDDDLVLTWQEGELDGLLVSLPFTPYRARAGQPFAVHVTLLDEFGNPLPDTYARLSVTDACTGYRSVEDVIGEADIEVTLTSACPVDRLTFFNSNVEVESDPFEVIPDDMVAYRVTATPDSAVRAGEQPVLVLVEAVDTWDNVVTEFGGAFTLSDQLAGLDMERTSCPSVSGGSALCTSYLRRAGTDVLLVVDDEGRSGTSNEVEVVADDPVSLSLSLAAPAVVAGDTVDASLGAYDAWGNVVTIEPGGVDAIAFTDDSGSIECDWTGPLAEGRQGFSCSFTRAWEDAAVEAELARLDLWGVAPDPITIVNAALGIVTVTAPTSTVAGAPFELELAGFDAYGNPYLVQGAVDVDLSDETGTLSPATVSLDSAGEARTTAAITRASGSTRITARQAGVALGSSAAMRVEAADMAGFDVEAEAWAVVGEELLVEVAPVDVYGNTVTAYTGTPTVSITGGVCEAEVLPAFGGSAQTAALSCVDSALGVTVQATDAAWSGTSGLVDVVDTGCPLGPVAALTVDGEAEPSLCLASGSVSADADASGSTAGGAAISVYSFEDEAGTRVRTAGGLATYTWTEAGAHRVSVLVADGAGCGAESSAWVWVGEDDGEVTGPVLLESSASSVASGGAVTVTAAAFDCTGDVAAGQDLYVRANLGQVGGTATGQGLVVALDAAGEGSFTWSFPAGYATPATLHAGSSSAGGYGTVSVAVTADSARPHVVRVTPAGQWSGSVESIVVEFDEPILASTVSALSLTGPSGAIALTTSVDEAVVTATPSAPLDASAGTYTLTVASNLRDEAGNRLDGAWSGAASAFTSVFGDVADTLPSMLGCTLSAESFRPDGDDGAAEEADSLTLTPVSSGSPAWWRLEVEDAAGERVRTARFVGTSGTVAWDGRADDGLVLPGGEFFVEVWAIDAQDNEESLCTEWITLEHRLELP